MIGNDRDLARQYAGRESASEKAARQRREKDEQAARKRRASHHRSATAADRQGQAWADAERDRQDRRGWWRSH